MTVTNKWKAPFNDLDWPSIDEPLANESAFLSVESYIWDKRLLDDHSVTLAVYEIISLVISWRDSLAIRLRPFRKQLNALLACYLRDSAF